MDKRACTSSCSSLVEVVGAEVVKIKVVGAEAAEVEVVGIEVVESKLEEVTSFLTFNHHLPIWDIGVDL
jgi:hypothetical protein